MSSSAAIEGIAIIGMAGRFPGADTLEEFWRILRDGVETISFFSDQELIAEGIEPELLRDPHFVKAGGVLSDIEFFDAAFFGIPPREAEMIDPQQRIFLECASEATEHAGYDLETFDGWVGVFAGVGMNGYLLNNLYPDRALLASVGTLQATIANDRDYLPTRVSYKLNLKGPSVNVQTACSTSLVAVHLACQSLLNGECDMALAGGVAARVPQKGGYLYQEGGIISPDGHCRAFDSRAGGTIFSSGAGVVLLKRLEDALTDGDHVHAVIRGSAINNDGAVKVGFTAPSVAGQAAVIAMAQAVAQVEPETIGYIEAHGTGTALGDPIEVAALTEVFRRSMSGTQCCPIGTAKTNIGHANAAAGIAGLIKTVLSLEHEQIPPSLHYERPNPQIDFARSPFYVNTELRPWPRGDSPRRAGVNSFGIGGTNAHVVLEEAPPLAPPEPPRPAELLVLSARSEAALDAVTARLAAHLRTHREHSLRDVAYTLAVGRRPFAYRRTLVCRDRDDAIALLAGGDAGRTRSIDQSDRTVTFLFPGQGTQYVGMAADLYRESAVFRHEIDRCATLLLPHLRLDLREILYAEAHSAQPRSPAADRLTQTALAQPALFAVEYALAQLWLSWGIRPTALIGHSVGEYVAATLAGVFSLEDALLLVATRGRLMQQAAPGAMLAVELAEHEVLPLLGDSLDLASINAPSRCVVSGSADEISRLEQRLGAQGVACRRLHTSHAFHSAMMEPIVDSFAAVVSRVTLRPPEIRYISNVTGTWIEASEATDPRYWSRHLRATVRFGDGIATLVSATDSGSDGLLLEVGPGQTLSTLARLQAGAGRARDVLSSMRQPHDPQSDLRRLLDTLGQLWLAGVAVDWRAVYAGERCRRVPLPSYPFERQRYWIDPPAAQPADKPAETRPRKKTDLADWFYLPVWHQSRPSALLQPAAAAYESAWLLLDDGSEIAATLHQRLAQIGQTLITVRAAAQFAQIDQHAYTIDPRRPDDYVALLDDLRARHTAPGRIIHLWSLMPPPDVEDAPQAALDAGFSSLFYLAQALGRQSAREPLQIEVVSSGVQAVLGDELIYPERAALLGPCRVIPHEYPHITCRSIDIVLPQHGAAPQRLIDQLVAELCAAPTDRTVAYRGRHRWTQTLDPVRLDAVSAPPVLLRDQGVYLITGGLGGMGIALAEQLAQTVQARLVLVGRSSLPDRAVWDQWLAEHADQDRTSYAIRGIRAIERLGGQVLVLRADVADQQAMRGVVQQVLAHFGALHGVIHAAGVAGTGLAQLKTAAEVEAVFAPKVLGLRALAAVLRDVSLDFLVLCSSTVAISGGAGLLEYAAANAVLDSFAHASAVSGGPRTISINWYGWQSIGMGRRTKVALSRSAAPRPATPGAAYHPLVEACVVETQAEVIYTATLSAATHWILSEHRIQGNVVVPGTAYLEMARAAFAAATGAQSAELRDVLLLQPLAMREDEAHEVRIVLELGAHGHSFQVISRSAGSDDAPLRWLEHARGTIAALSDAPPQQHDMEQIRATCAEQEIVVSQESQRDQSGRFVWWGPRWHSVRKVHLGTGRALALLELAPEFAADLDDYKLHPALLDTATALGAQLMSAGIYLPLSYKRLAIRQPLPQTIYSVISAAEGAQPDGETATFDITLLDQQGRELVAIEGFVLRRASPALLERLAAQRTADQAAAQLTEADRRALELAIATDEGKDAFLRILANPSVAQIVVLPVELPGGIDRFLLGTAQRSDQQPSQQQELHPRPELHKAYAAPTNQLEAKVAEIWQALLGIDQVGINDNFFELGGDSLMATKVLARLREVFPVDLPLQLLFEASTVTALAEQIEELLTAKIEELPEEEAQQMLDRLFT